MSTFPTPQTPTLARVTAQALARHADHAFGLMGNGNAHLLDAFPDSGIAFTAVRHEAGAVAAADAYTRVSGRLAIATTTYGAGFTNTLTALAEAAQASIPMLLVVGDAPEGGPRPWDIDQELAATAVGVRTYSLTLDDPAKQVDRAAAKALERRRPVVLALPYDLTTAVVERPGGIDLDDPAVMQDLLAATRPQGAHAAPSGAAPLTPEAPGQPGSAGFAAAVAALTGAVRPAIIAGHGAWLAGSAPSLGVVADQLGAVTATSALTRSIFPRPEFDLGVAGGFGQEAAMALLETADVVLVVGASLNQFTMRFGDLFGPGTTVVRIDRDPVGPPKTNHPIDYHVLQGDAVAMLDALSLALAASRPVPSGWRESVVGLAPGGALRVRDTGFTQHPTGICADGLLDPRSVAATIADLLPADRYVTSDGGHFIGWANMFWPVASPERMVMVGTAYQTIGLGFPTVAGVAAAAPSGTVVLSTGDGGGLMALADLETAIRTAPSLVIVVWNDAAYGAEVHLYGRMGLGQDPMHIPAVDFAGVARALGAQAVRVESLADLSALGEWRAAGCHGTLLLDCRISRSVVAPYQYEILRVNGVAAE